MSAAALHAAKPCATHPRQLTHSRRAQSLRPKAAASFQGPPASEGRLRHVVFAATPDEASLEAWLWTLTNLWQQGSTQLTLLHVVPELTGVHHNPAPGHVFFIPPDASDADLEQTLMAQAHDFLERHFVSHAKCRGAQVNVVVERETRHKHAGYLVCKKAEELGAEPLVLAAHDKNWLEEWLAPSMSKYTLSHSKRPVLLLHPEHSMLDSAPPATCTPTAQQ